MVKFGKKSSVIGLDIGSKTTKIVQLSFNGTGNPSLERCDLLESGLGEAEFEGNIKSYFKQNRLTNAMVASSMDDPSMKIRKMELPKMPDLDLIEAIKWNLRDIIDGNIDDFAVSFSKITEYEDAESPRLDLMAYAVNRNAVQDYQILIQKLGVQPYFIEPVAVTLASVLDRCYGDDDSYISGVHIGNKLSFFYVVGKRVFVFSRPMPGISLESYAKDNEGFNQRAAIEIQKSIDTFKVNFKMEEVNKLYLSGGGAYIPDIKEYFGRNLGLHTELLNPFVTLTNVENFGDVKSALFVQAIGLAYLQP